MTNAMKKIIILLVIFALLIPFFAGLKVEASTT